MSRRVCGFVARKETWYYIPDTGDSFTVGIYYVDPNQGTDGEFEIELKDSTIGAIFRVFNDAGPCFEEKPFQDLWEAHLEGSVPYDHEELKSFLLELGFEDITERENPYEKPKEYLYVAFESAPDYTAGPARFHSIHKTLEDAERALYPGHSYNFTKSNYVDDLWVGPDGFGSIRKVEVK